MITKDDREQLAEAMKDQRKFEAEGAAILDKLFKYVHSLEPYNFHWREPEDKKKMDVEARNDLCEELTEFLTNREQRMTLDVDQGSY